MYVVSNTEVSTRNLCERMHYYRFIKDDGGIEPSYLAINTPLGTGLLGHRAMEAYYLAVKDGGTVRDALAAAREVLQFEVIRLATEEPEQFEQLQRVVQLQNLIEAYSNHYTNDTFKILEVEKVFTTSITQDIFFGLRLDLLVEYTRGDLRGELAVWDHKFVYNFKTPAEIEMDSQLPKYIKALQDNNYPVRRGVFNQLRYRDMKDPTFEQLFKRSKLSDPTKIEIETIWDEQASTAQKIADIATGKKLAAPIRNQHILTCKHCYFQGLCKADLMGTDTTQMVKANFQANQHRYTDYIDVGDAA